MSNTKVLFKSNIICECHTIDWSNYHIHDDSCKSCYCKWIREDITYTVYEDRCVISKKNSGRKFKELCMVSN
jgi:hypothetical protein